MPAATVIEAPLALEPVGPDSFISDLEDRTPEAQRRLADLVQRVSAAPRRRIADGRAR